MRPPAFNIVTSGKEVVRISGTASNHRSIRLYIDGVAQDNIKSVDLLAFQTQGRRNLHNAPS